MRIDGETTILGVLGYPIKHSFSPLIHNYLLEKLNFNSLYIPLNLKPNEVKNFITAMKNLDNLIGINVTVPFKTKVIKYIDELSSESKIIGAANTIKKKNNVLKGYNTDTFGFIESLKINFPEIKANESCALIVGAGGAARSVLYSLLKSKFKKIFIANRTIQKAEKLKNTFKKFFKNSIIEVIPLTTNVLKEKKVNLIINATSAGLKKTDKLLLDLTYVKNHNTIVYDLIYNPPKTNLLINAQKNKLKTINGLDMLILQALKSFNIWFGVNVLNEYLNIKKMLLSVMK